MATRIRYAEIVDRGVRICFGTEERLVDLPSRWLRDHGDDEASTDPLTRQRRVDTFAIPADIEPRELTFGEGRLLVWWSDGASTEHDAAALADRIEDRRRPRPERDDRVILIRPELELWTGSDESSAPLDAGALSEPEGMIVLLGQLHRRGWAMVDEVEPGADALTDLTDRIGYVRQTIFGGVWDLRAGAEEHLDSAYGRSALDVHTDSTYSHDAPGVQVFSCQQRDGSGGEAVLVDGFAAVRDLALAEPQLADCLTRFDLVGQYIEPGVHLQAEHPLIRLDSTGYLVQVSFNNHDRAAMLPTDEWVETLIDAYGAFHQLVSDPQRQIRLGWKPGRVLLVDNWRVLHGRASFTGARRFVGSYLNHEDLESVLRVNGITKR